MWLYAFAFFYLCCQRLFVYRLIDLQSLLFKERDPGLGVLAQNDFGLSHTAPAVDPFPHPSISVRLFSCLQNSYETSECCTERQLRIWKLSWLCLRDHF